MLVGSGHASSNGSFSLNASSTDGDATEDRRYHLLRDGERKRGAVLRGALLLTAACFFMPMNDVCAKLLGRHDAYPLSQVVFMRFATQFCIVAPLAAWWHTLRVPRPLLNVSRGVLHLAMTFTFYGAIRYVPLANAMAITFFNAVLLVLLSCAPRPAQRQRPRAAPPAASAPGAHGRLAPLAGRSCCGSA